MPAFRLIVTGRVQGVGFRWSTRAEAERVGARGWVRNRRDGTVEIHVEGDPEAVDHVRRWAHAGPPGARVETVKEHAARHEDATAFEIRHRPGPGGREA